MSNKNITTDEVDFDGDKQSKIEESELKFKAILLCVLPTLTLFLIFCFFFINTLEK